MVEMDRKPVNRNIQKEATVETTTTQTRSRLTEHLATKQQTEVETLKKSVSKELSKLRKAAAFYTMSTFVGGGIAATSGFISLTAAIAADPIVLATSFGIGLVITVGSALGLSSAIEKIENLVELNKEE
ncbi:MAG: hypothetical protein ABR981_05540 [Candidatus Micrarchaeaceae archaeon]|jgi:hypothetical protein